jgi:ABC-type antimicrobial peptide transport system permease subunit
LYVALQPNAAYDQAASKSKLLVKKYAPETYATFQQELALQPLKTGICTATTTTAIATGGLIDYIKMFSIVGILVLLIACINFMNLATARSAKRAREVGVRKVIGSSRIGLIGQFLVESVMLTFIAFVLSLIIIQLVFARFQFSCRHLILAFLIQIAFSGLSCQAMCC